MEHSQPSFFHEISCAADGRPVSTYSKRPACQGPSAPAPRNTSRRRRREGRLRARNCTTQAQSATLTWLGRFSDAGGGIPAGCPVIDPLAQPAQFAPRGRIRVHLGFTVPAACTATSLQETARLSGAGGVVFAEQTATLAISPTDP